MASIEKRISNDGISNYRVKVRLRGYPIQTATFERLSDAKRWAQQTEVAIREGRYFKTTESRKHTLADLADRYINSVLAIHPKKREKQTRQFEWWINSIGYYSLADVTPQLIAEQRDKLSMGITRTGNQRTAATVNRYLGALSHAFTIGIKEWGWCEDNPVLKVNKLKEPRGRVRFLSDEERTRLLEECKQSHNPYLFLIVVLALSTGARRMEILSLRWFNINLARQSIVLHETKNGERRALPLVGYSYELMKEHAKMRNIKTDFVFPGKSLRFPTDITTAWEMALKRAEITDFRFHDLRHSAASYLAMNGASIAEIAEVLGHKTLQMVKRYAHLSESHTSRVVASMNEKIFASVEQQQSQNSSLL
jgi:integrase